MMDNLKPARIYSYARLMYVVTYAILVIGLFLWDLTIMARIPWTSHDGINWFQFDIPSLCMVILVWLPALQNVSYRRNVLNILVDEANSTCMIAEGRFAGRWRLRKKSSQSMSTLKVLAIFGLVLIAIIVAIDISLLLKAITPSSKVLAVQGLCGAASLLGIFTPTFSLWRYPYMVVVRQRGKWLSLQYRD